MLARGVSVSTRCGDCRYYRGGASGACGAPRPSGIRAGNGVMLAVRVAADARLSCAAWAPREGMWQVVIIAPHPTQRAGEPSRRVLSEHPTAREAESAAIARRTEDARRYPGGARCPDLVYVREVPTSPEAAREVLP